MGDVDMPLLDAGVLGRRLTAAEARQLQAWLVTQERGAAHTSSCHLSQRHSVLCRWMHAAFEMSPQASPGTRFEQETRALAGFLIRHLAAELEFAVTCMAALGILLRTSRAEQVLAMHSGISCSGDTGFALVQRLIQQPEGQAALGAFLAQEDAIASVEALRPGTIGRVTNPAVLASEPPEVYRPLLPATPFILERGAALCRDLHPHMDSLFWVDSVVTLVHAAATLSSGPSSLKRLLPDPTSTEKLVELLAWMVDAPAWLCASRGDCGRLQMSLTPEMLHVVWCSCGVNLLEAIWTVSKTWFLSEVAAVGTTKAAAALLRLIGQASPTALPSAGWRAPAANLLWHMCAGPGRGDWTPTSAMLLDGAVTAAPVASRKDLMQEVQDAAGALLKGNTMSDIDTKAAALSTVASVCCSLTNHWDWSAAARVRTSDSSTRLLLAWSNMLWEIVAVVKDKWLVQNIATPGRFARLCAIQLGNNEHPDNEPKTTEAYMYTALCQVTCAAAKMLEQVGEEPAVQADRRSLPRNTPRGPSLKARVETRPAVHLATWQPQRRAAVAQLLPVCSALGYAHVSSLGSMFARAAASDGLLALLDPYCSASSAMSLCLDAMIIDCSHGGGGGGDSGGGVQQDALLSAYAVCVTGQLAQACSLYLGVARTPGLPTQLTLPMLMTGLLTVGRAGQQLEAVAKRGPEIAAALQSKDVVHQAVICLAQITERAHSPAFGDAFSSLCRGIAAVLEHSPVARATFAAQQPAQQHVDQLVGVQPELARMAWPELAAHIQQRLPRRLLHRCNTDLAAFDAALAGSSSDKDMANAAAAAQAAADELLQEEGVASTNPVASSKAARKRARKKAQAATAIAAGDATAAVATPSTRSQPSPPQPQQEPAQPQPVTAAAGEHVFAGGNLADHDAPQVDSTAPAPSKAARKRARRKATAAAAAAGPDAVPVAAAATAASQAAEPAAHAESAVAAAAAASCTADELSRRPASVDQCNGEAAAAGDAELPDAVQALELDGGDSEANAPAAEADDWSICPITKARFVDPVLAADGRTYSRAAITAWMEVHGTSPVTGDPLPHRNLTPNYTLRSLLEAMQPSG